MIKIKNMRQPYGTGRIPLKISLTPELLKALEAQGIIKRETNRLTGSIKAKKGGSGSSFAEFVMRMFLTMIENDQEGLDALAESLKDSLDEESLAILTNNLGRLKSIINEEDTVPVL